MRYRLIELHIERGRLLERIASQRHELAQQVMPLQRTLHFGDRLAAIGLQGKLFALQHPLAVAAALGAIVVLRPGFVLRWSRRAFVTWRTWTAMQSLAPDFIARLMRRRPQPR